jgi:hypothetical protein
MSSKKFQTKIMLKERHKAKKIERKAIRDVYQLSKLSHKEEFLLSCCKSHENKHSKLEDQLGEEGFKHFIEAKRDLCRKKDSAKRTGKNLRIKIPLGTRTVKGFGSIHDYPKSILEKTFKKSKKQKKQELYNSFYQDYDIVMEY